MSQQNFHFITVNLVIRNFKTIISWRIWDAISQVRFNRYKPHPRRGSLNYIRQLNILVLQKKSYYQILLWGCSFYPETIHLDHSHCWQTWEPEIVLMLSWEKFLGTVRSRKTYSLASGYLLWRTSQTWYPNREEMLILNNNDTKKTSSRWYLEEYV